MSNFERQKMDIIFKILECACRVKFSPNILEVAQKLLPQYIWTFFFQSITVQYMIEYNLIIDQANDLLIKLSKRKKWGIFYNTYQDWIVKIIDLKNTYNICRSNILTSISSYTCSKKYVYPEAYFIKKRALRDNIYTLTNIIVEDGLYILIKDDGETQCMVENYVLELNYSV